MQASSALHCLPGRALLVCALVGLGACWRGSPPPTAPQRLTHRVREILAREEPSPRFYRERGRLESMGAELDPVLVGLVNSRDADETVRANALLLLADRGSYAALPVLRRVLLSAPEEHLRTSAVLGLQRLAGSSPEAAAAIRAAIGDPSRRVRLSVLQALDVEDVPLIRELLAREEDAQVRTVARELVSLAESRGAPLPREADGTYRTTSPKGGAQIVFQPTWRDTVAGVEVGALWAETSRPRLVPLAQRVEVVAGVVPAFFSRDRTWVVYEAEREIRLRNLKSGETRVLGPGVAPRVIPFADGFVYLEERPGARREVQGGTEVAYEVLRVPFTGGAAERLGRLLAVARPERHGNASPVRWMVVGESPEGFVLRGEGMRPFLLPNPFPASPPKRPTRARRSTRGRPD
jgi:hypothetical protein